MPTRISSLRRVLPRILPQLDRLYLFLDKYAEPPPESKHQKIICLTSQVEGLRLGPSGKLLGLTLERSPVVYAMFDDDILYPASYVQTLVRGLIRHRGRAMVGFHACRYVPPYASFLNDRIVYSFHKAMFFDRQVDQLGSGTTALLSEMLDVDPRGWPHGDMDDLMLALEAERRGIPRIALRRHRWYLRAIATDQPDSIYRRVRQDETRHAPYLAELMRLLGRSGTESQGVR